MRKKWLKPTAIVTLFSFLVNMFYPTSAYALTGGPSHPEVESFEPASTTEMVDPFTGDFNYNLPLLTIPGPNGGYPINLAYHAGVGMEQEASWVGLGWNLNPGSINRNMRGLPDDFKGDKVRQKFTYKPSETVSIGVNVDVPLPEIYGADISMIGLSLNNNINFYYNNYTGVGLRYTLGIGVAPPNSGVEGSVGLTFDTNEGMSISPSFSYQGKIKNASYEASIGFSYSGREGFNSFNVGIKGSTSFTKRTSSGMKSYGLNGGFGTSTNFSGNLPSISYNTQGYDLGLSFKFQAGGGGSELPIPITISGNFSRDYLNDDFKDVEIAAYGYNHMGDRVADNTPYALMDYNREKDYPVHVRVPFMPVPIFTNDIYQITGHGVAGTFRPFRSDFGLLYEPMTESHSGSGSLGVEFGGESGPPGVKVSLNPFGSYSYGYKGKWTVGLDQLNELNFKRDVYFMHDPALSVIPKGITVDRQFYYKSMGEFTAMPTNFMDHVGGEAPVKFAQVPLQTNNSDLTGNMQPDPNEPAYGNNTGFLSQLQPAFSGLDNDARSIRTVKEKNVQDIHYLTRREKTYYIDYADRADMIYPIGQFPVFDLDQKNTNYNTQKLAYQYGYDIDQLETGHGFDPSTGLGNLSIGHHVAEYSIINPDGNRYTYGLPVYNTKEVNVTFSVADQEGKDYPRIKQYNGSDAGLGNTQGIDNYFSSSEIPAYAYSYLLTEITSTDYVDITGNGCTEDDYGYYTKFNYSPVTNDDNYYKWRFPYAKNKGSNAPGYFSNPNDNKVSYNYGEKEIWYMNSIETKTHVAVFRTSPRFDGVGAGEHGNPETNIGLRKLDRIDLYSKEEIRLAIAESRPPVPIKSVHFAYSYDLCGNTPNNLKTLGLPYTASNNHPHPLMSGLDENANGGKLTLKKVWFTYKNNNKGALSPYYFDYFERDSPTQMNADNNPNYQYSQVDRWGNFRPDDDYGVTTINGRHKNTDNPYVFQERENKTEVDKQVSSWNLKQIILPSGGKIDINYETDDYAYVQDKVAHQMCEVVGSGPNRVGDQTVYDPEHDDFFALPASNNNEANSVNLFNETTRIYFRPEYPLSSNASTADEQVQKYISGLLNNFLYFKMYMRLKIPKSTVYPFAYDYVQGYCKVKGAGYINVPSNGAQITGLDPGNAIYQDDIANNNIDFNKVPYVEIEPVSVGTNTWNAMRFAGWQYLKHSRSDLSNDTNGLGILGIVYHLFMSIAELFNGYYSTQDFKGHCKFIHKDRPSYIRLSSPDQIKYGGGYRVKSIKVKDNWNSVGGDESEYGNNYFYKMKDGTSSGVASYEPVIGSEEIALKKPHYYSSSDNMLYANPDFYLEEPFGENYFPASQVGYRRVIIENIHHGKKYAFDPPDKVLKTMEGITEYLFYTSKEFPVVVEHTNNPRDMYINLPINIPLIGNLDIKSAAYSQAYKIEVNDMHGKLRAMNIYDADEDKNGDGVFESNNPQPTKGSEYRYQTKQNFDDNLVNRLDNEAPVLIANGVTENAILGQNFEFFGDMQQDDAFSFGAGLNVNITYQAPVIFVPFLIPSIELSMSRSQMVTTNKVIYKNGILKETVSRFEGNTTHMINELWDAETGDVLLSRVTTDYNNNPNDATNDFVYDYSIPAHWNYKGMEGSYKNYRALIKFENSSTPGYYKISNYNDYTDLLLEGDVVMFHTLLGGSLNPVLNKVYWVSSIQYNSGSGETLFKLMNKDGVDNPGLSGYLKVVRPVRRNMQNYEAGRIQSLTNPVSNQFNNLITAYNAALPNPGTLFEVTDCATDASQDAKAILASSGGNKFFSLLVYPDGNSDVPCYTLDAQIPDHISSAYYKILHITNNFVEFEISPGNTFLAPIISYENNCNNSCLDNVLNASASEFTNHYTYNYDDFRGLPAAFASNNNSYWKGVRGIWRLRKSLTYDTKRKQTDVSNSTSNFNSYAGKDGTFEKFNFFNWRSPDASNIDATQPSWIFTSIFTRFAPLGWSYESMDPLGNYSTELYSRDHSLVLASAANASAMEIGYDGFETYQAGYPTSITTNDYYGHLPFTNVGSFPTNASISSSASHTGNFSISIPPAIVPSCTTTVYQSINNSTPSTGNTFRAFLGKTYLISAWIRKPGVNFSNTATIPGIDVIYPTIGSGSQTLTLRIQQGKSIDSWYKVEGTFKPTDVGDVVINLISGTVGTGCFIDDIRVQPVNSGMKTYVYDWYTFRLLAEMDNNNFATFYNYDEEGKLVQVKQETEKGIFTVSANRNNVKRQ